MLVVISITGIILIIFWGYLKYHFKYWKRRQIPHLPPSILKGNMKEWIRSKHYAEIFADTYDKFKDKDNLFAGFYLNTKIAVIILDLSLVQNILGRHFSFFENRGLFHNERNDPLTGNLFLLDGPKWKSLRSKLTPTFSTANMKYIMPSVIEVAEELPDLFEHKITETGDGVFNVTYILDRFTCDVIGNCIFGLKSEDMKDPNYLFSFMARKFFSERRHCATVEGLINSFPERAKSLRMKIIPQSVTDYYMDIFKETIKERENKKIKKADYFDLLLELKKRPDKNGEKQLTTEELAAQAFVFFITALDTCSSTMSCALYEIAKHPEIQNKLRTEIIQTLRTHKHKFTFDALRNMHYLDQVVSETLRKYPAFPALFRKCTKSYIPFNTPHFNIEKGCVVIIPTLSMHYDDKYFPNPFDFDPDRFSTENAANIIPYSYLPFGDGQRNCIGNLFARMIVKIALIRLITNFQFETCDRTTVPLKVVIDSFNLYPTDVTLKVERLW